MKKKRVGKVLVVIALVCIMLGAMMIGAGFASGGSISSLHVGKDNTSWWPFHVSIGLYHDGEFGIITSEEDDDNTASWDRELPSGTKLKIDMDQGDIKVKKGAGASVQFTKIKESNVSFYEEDGTQVIKIKHPNHFMNINGGRIEITLPEKDYDLEIDNNLGDITIEDLSFDHLDIDNDLGDITLSSILSKDTSIEENSGDVSVQGTFGGRTKIENDLGDIQIDLNGDRDAYALEVSNHLGDTNIDGEIHEFQSKIKENKGKADSLKVENHLGYIRITFR